MNIRRLLSFKYRINILVDFFFLILLLQKNTTGISLRIVVAFFRIDILVFMVNNIASEMMISHIRYFPLIMIESIVTFILNSHQSHF